MESHDGQVGNKGNLLGYAGRAGLSWGAPVMPFF